MNEGFTLMFILGSVILMGYLGNYLFKRTGIPDMLFLIALGIIFGPILGVFDPTSIMELAPYIAALSLVIILFDGGLKMGIYEVFSGSPRAALLSTLGFVFAVVVIALFVHLVMGLPLIYAVLFGAIFGGGGSSIAVLSVVTRVTMSPSCETVLSLESVIDDVLCTVISLVVIGVIITGHVDSMMIARDIAGQFSVGMMMGLLSGLIWLFLLRRMTKEPYAYMLTLAAAFFTYAIAEYLGGNGALSSLLFGIVLGNENEILKFFNRPSTGNVCVDVGLMRFEEEIAFAIRSFFFVYLGLLMVTIDLYSLFWGLILSTLLLVIRYGTVRLATISSPLCEETSVMSVVLTRGLVAAILATIPMQYGLLYGELFLNVTIIVIITTAIFSTVGVLALSRNKRVPHPIK
ncbi:MAG: cation:proton antiporter [Candidatus Bathyarchaeota archaeon]|nr:MAG: cation:proton antiporter [Candidatus Bathyarchaeota archaeon]